MNAPTPALPQCHDVAIVGLGPVGAAAAILLAEAGLSVVAFERDPEVYRLPRAVNLDGEIVRAFQAVGRGEEVAALLQPVRPGERAGFANSRREWLFGQRARPFGSNGWQSMNMFDQPELENWLRRTALNHRNVSAHIGWQVTSVIGSEQDVLLAARQVDGQARLQAHARYVIGCDGAGSMVRSLIGSSWRDLGYDCEWLVVDVTTKPGHTLDTTTLQVCDPERLSTYVATKDPYRRWEFRLNPGETREAMLAPDTIRALIDPWTPRGTYEIRRAAVYQFHAATAGTWRRGRTFIAGDAAHQTPPFLGQGMNGGMRDVINLAWKLPLVLRGVAGDALLDTYQAERDAHAHDLTDWAVAIGRLMEHQAAIEAAERAGQPAPSAPPALRSAGYGQGREQPPLRAGCVLTGQVSDNGSAGYLFRQPIVTDVHGNERRLDDVLGHGFVLVGRTPADVEISPAARAIVERLGGTTASIAGLEPVQGRFDAVFDAHAAVLVRPDHYVFGHTTDTLDASALCLALAEQVGMAAG